MGIGPWYDRRSGYVRTPYILETCSWSRFAGNRLQRKIQPHGRNGAGDRLVWFIWFILFVWFIWLIWFIWLMRSILSIWSVRWVLPVRSVD